MAANSEWWSGAIAASGAGAIAMTATSGAGAIAMTATSGASAIAATSGAGATESTSGAGATESTSAIGGSTVTRGHRGHGCGHHARFETRRTTGRDELLGPARVCALRGAAPDRTFAVT
jgi:hypothetical protein